MEKKNNVTEFVMTDEIRKGSKLANLVDEKSIKKFTL